MQIRTRAYNYHFELPEFTHVRRGVTKGRNVREGYARGWGLQFGTLRAAVAEDPLYRDAVALAGGRTVQSEANRMNIFLLLKFFVGRLSAGHLIEFGSYKGGSAIFMAKVCSVLHPGMQVYALDTFSGMPAADAAVDAHGAGDFNDVDFAELERYVAALRLGNLHLVRGLFQETAPTLLAGTEGIRLAHIDCDIRPAVAYAYEVVRPHMVPGGYLVFDDALFSSCLGATEVVEDLLIRRDGLNSEQVFPQYVFRAPGAL